VLDETPDTDSIELGIFYRLVGHSLEAMWDWRLSLDTDVSGKIGEEGSE